MAAPCLTFRALTFKGPWPLPCPRLLRTCSKYTGQKDKGAHPGFIGNQGSHSRIPLLTTDKVPTMCHTLSLETQH